MAAYAGMTIEEIRSYASTRLRKREIDPEDAIDWVNDILLELGADAWRLTTTTVVATSKAWATLPTDCIKIYHVDDSAGDRYDEDLWEAEVGRIRFYDAGTYTVEYFKVPNLIPATSTGSDIPDCHPQLHMALAYYITYRAESPDFPADKETNVWYAEFDRKKRSSMGQLQKPRRRIRAPRWS